MSAEENKAVVHRGFEEVWNRRNPDVIDEILAADYVGHVTGSPDIHGPVNYKKFAGVFLSAFPDNHFTIDDQFTEGDKIVTRWTFTGTHRGELAGISPTGARVTNPGITIHRIAGGRIAEEWSNWDALGMWQQLGVVPPIGE